MDKGTLPVHAPLSIVLFRASTFFFSAGTFWNGAYSTTAYDSLPGCENTL